MVGATSNIYVSITGPRSSGREEGYRRPLHGWLISIEPHHNHVPGIPGTSSQHKSHEPIHYAATQDRETGLWSIDSHEMTEEPGIIGNILIVEAAHMSSDKLFALLKDDVAPHSPSAPSRDTAASDDEPEHWVRSAIRGLQRRSVAKTFDIDEFVTFAHGYVANRMDNEAPALIAYPKIHHEPEKKSSKHRFWLSYPMANRTRTNSRGEASKYGGLM